MFTLLKLGSPKITDPSPHKETQLTFNFPLWSVDDSLATEVASALRMNPEILDSIEGGADDSYDFVDHSTFLPSDDTESHRDGSEVSLGDSAAGEAPSVTAGTAFDDDMAYDSDDSSYIPSPQAALPASQTDAQSNDTASHPSSLEALGETQMFNSTLTSRTITQSQVDIKPPTTDGTEHESPSSDAHRLKPGKLWKLNLTKPFRLLYHGPSEYKDSIVEKIAQAIATTATIASTAEVFTDGGARFSIVPISFDDPHVTLIPSTGLELIVTEAGNCFDDSDEVFNALKLTHSHPHWCNGLKPDLALFLHGTSQGRLENSFICSTSMSLHGIGTFDLSLAGEKFPSTLALCKLNAVEHTAAGRAFPHIEEFETMRLDEFLDLDATSLSSEIAWATGLVTIAKSDKSEWKILASAKARLHSIINHINSGYNSMIHSAKDSYLSLNSFVRHTCKQSLATTKAKVEQLKTLPLPRSLDRKIKAAVSIVSIPSLVLLCYLLTYQLWMPWALSTYHRMSSPGSIELTVHSVNPMNSVWLTATSKEIPLKLVASSIHQVATSIVSSAPVHPFAPLHPHGSGHKASAKETLALQVFSHDGKRFLRLTPGSFALRKAPEIFLNATSGAKTINASITKINATLYEFKVDTRNIKGPVDIFAWTKGSAPLSLNFTIVDHQRALSIHGLRSFFSMPIRHRTSKGLKGPRTPTIDAGKLMRASFTAVPLAEKMRGFANFTSTTFYKTSQRLHNGHKLLNNSIVSLVSDHTLLALTASQETISRVSTNVGHNVKQSLYIVSNKFTLSSPIRFGSNTLQKARVRALALSKKLSSTKLDTNAVQENPARGETVKQMPGKLTALTQGFTRNVDHYIRKTSKMSLFKHKPSPPVKSKESARAKKDSKRGGKHREYVTKKSERQAGAERFASRLAQLVPQW